MSCSVGYAAGFGPKAQTFGPSYLRLGWAAKTGYLSVKIHVLLTPSTKNVIILVEKLFGGGFIIQITR
ncbi:hypothetical protein MHI18_03535 [Peribacillus sp. FSL H8-0477]|uniref:hypothetical protein n=1 Tax=Peribacillus sp. FSL H8-0477 TaxID=2921388 RepID=UPI0030FB1A2A